MPATLLKSPVEEILSKSLPDLDPMLPAYQDSRDKRSRAPIPFEYRGRPQDVMGMASGNKLVLRDTRLMHRDVRLEDFAGETATLHDVLWRVASLEAEPLLTTPLELRSILRLSHPTHMAPTVIVSQEDLQEVRFHSKDGEHAPGRIKHGIMRLTCALTPEDTRLRLRPGQQFEARLRRRELQGPFLVRLAANGSLFAKPSRGQTCHEREIEVEPADIAPRYSRVFSPDFRADFDVDTFLFQEDKLRSCPNGGGVSGLNHEPVLGILRAGRHKANMPNMTHGATHLGVFDGYIRKHTPITAGTDPCFSRRLTILNLSVSNQGDAKCVLDALINFRLHNPTATINVISSKLGPAEFQKSPDYRRYLSTLAKNDIQINDYTNGANRYTRQVMHGKAIIIDNHVLFSTGAIMDTWPINKADFAVELPRVAAKIFAEYVDRAIVHGDLITPRCRVELATKLAGLGIMINDPVVGLAFNSRAQNALIHKARDKLLISMSELVDVDVAMLIIRRAIEGVQVTVQVRELDAASARLLHMFTLILPNLRVEDSSTWEPRPHWNMIVADDDIAYLGTSYLWPTQRNMIHQGRSFENGMLLGREATQRISDQVECLRARNLKSKGKNPVLLMHSSS